MTNPSDFAFQTTVWSKNPDGTTMFSELTPGLTKREWFAGMAMCGMLQRHNAWDLNETEISINSVLYADALIAEMSKEPQEVT